MQASPIIDAKTIVARGFVNHAEADALKDNDYPTVKINLTEGNGSNGEGIWAYLLSEEDKKLHDSDDSHGEEFFCVLSNHAVAWFPNPTWGRVLRARTNGSSRPCAVIDEQTERLQATHEAYWEEWKDVLGKNDEDEEEEG